MTETRPADAQLPDDAPLFDVHARTRITAPPDKLYATVSDLPRSGEWSVECTGGRWISGTPGVVGAVFRGENRRAADVVAWAPVVRGGWTTDSEVVEAVPGRVFRWAVRDSGGRAQESVWSFEVSPDGSGSVLVHRFRMGRATEGIRGITSGMDAAQRRRFFDDWTAKLSADLAETVRRIKRLTEQS